MVLLQRVRQFVRQHRLWRSDTRVVVALSGGSDSVALAVLLHELDARGEVRRVGAAHFNHQLRADALRDEDFSAAVAQSLNLPFVADRDDIAARRRRERRSLEDAARQARYEFFERARLQFAADVVALGHTRDDQAETFLLRLIRGSGPRGLAGIHPRRDTIIRPVLGCRRVELREYLRARHRAFVEDETNADVAIPRNRIRAELLPLLAVRFNPGIVDVLAREAELAREVWAWMESAAADFEAESGSSVRETGQDSEPGPVVLDVARLQEAPPAFRRLVLWRAMSQVAGSRPVSFDHVDAALELLGTDAGRRSVDVPGHRVERNGPELVLTRREGGAPRRQRRAKTALVNLFEYSLSIPGEVRLAEAGCVVMAEVGDAAAGTALAQADEGRFAAVRRDLCSGPLTVRNRRPGDHFRPLGVNGRKKLQDYFVDRKVARTERDRVPLVVDELGRIVWVAGHGIDEAFHLTEPSQGVLLLRLRQA